MSRGAEIERSFQSDTLTWHAIAVAPGWERRVVDDLREAGFEPYLPEMAVTGLRKGLLVLQRRLVIPSYVFVRLAIWADARWGQINRHDMDGVIGIIRDGALPIAIPDAQMDRLARLEHVEGDIEPILEWLAKAGEIMRVSNHKRKAQARQRGYLAKLAAS